MHESAPIVMMRHLAELQYKLLFKNLAKQFLSDFFFKKIPYSPWMVGWLEHDVCILDQSD